ncbi:MAG TPA: sigma 54-interacting transcriptional regulator [Kofleriaceae bacterium]|nr:sigma 54-interacting transcriptional regulator [Kofleriaceae bacterium]
MPPRYLLATAQGGVHIHKLPSVGTAVLGRGPGCQVLLEDPSISREHARLEIGSACTITDLGSRNGTHFRGQRLVQGEPCRVGAGESFALGSVSVLLLPAGANPPIAAIAGSRLCVEDPTADDSSGLLTAIARTSVSALLLGETGVGKEVLAARIHELSGRKGPLVAVNCAALSETLLESELFGHEKGAFTGASQAKPGLLQTAAAGTLLLDEIGEMSPSVQAKMLRAIETQSILPLGGVRPLTIDVRFLAATHRDLLAAGGGVFRRDLYYRVAGFSLVIPPLRDRRSQIVRLATEILTASAAQSGAAIPTLTPAATIALATHDWPGNVRELRNVMMRALVLARGGEVDVEHVLFDTRSDGLPSQPAVVNERERILAALEACAGNQTRAARALGMSRSTFIQKLRLLDVPRPRVRG